MEWINNRLMTYYYHSIKGKTSKDFNSWLNRIKEGKMSRRVVLDSKRLTRVNRENAMGKPWIDKNDKPINPDHIIKCYDMYKQGKMTSRQLFDHFPGRTMKAIESKVWKIRGRSEKDAYDNPNQEDLFRKQIDK